MPDTTVVEPAQGQTDDLNLFSSRDPTPHAEHEAAADDLSLADLASNPPTDSATVEDSEIPPEGDEADPAAPEATPETAPEPESLGKVAAAKAKLASSVKPAAAKVNGAPAGAKKILNAGIFGAGKSVSSKPTTSAAPSAAPKPAAVPLKKSTSGSAPTTKPTMASKPAVASTTAPARRASIAPTKASAPPLTKPSLSSSSSSKPTTASSAATARGVVSPVGSAANGKSAATPTARPRASVSDGVKRTPLTARQSLSATSKPPSTIASKASTSTATARASAAKTSSVAPKSRTSASITSIKEVHEDTKALEDLQNKLQEATDSLVAKSEAAIELEGQVENLKASLATALVEVETKGSTATELTEAKAASEAQLKEATEALAKLQLEHQGETSTLQSIQEDLAAAKAATTAQKDLIETLQAQIQSLETEISASKENLESLQLSHSGAAAEATLAAAVEHEALLKAQADFSQIEVEIQALKAAHTQTLEEAHAKIQAAEDKAALAQSLEEQLAELRAEKEDAVAKLSEIEVEVLELKESQETVEDERVKTAARITSLEEELSKAIAATQQVIDDASAKESEYASQAEGIKASHEGELKAASEAHAQITSQLEALKAELEGALSAHQAATEEHTRRLGDAEEGYLKKQTELSEEIRRITTELEGQEAQYNAKVDAVKAEHDKLLQETFERAKAEASDLHQQDLQALRAGSSSTMEQVRAAHDSALQDLKAEHASALESTVGDLEKQISKLSLELKATQDDLSKAKAKVDVARSEIESLTAQRDEARAALSAVPEVSPQHVEEVTRLSSELGRCKDDLQAVTEMLDLTKASLQEMSNNHTVELQEAAKGRAEEVTKLRNIHDEEVTALATQKSELLTKLSDLEGELATLKASLDAEAAAPKSNGNGAVAVPQSPGITKEELQRMHEAHNLKVHDLQAEHEKAIKALKEDLEVSETKVDGLNAEVGRKAMEIQYLESDQDEQTERITRLQEDLEAANEKIKALGGATE